MKKLIKADLADILKLVPIYQPVPTERIDGDISELCRCEHTDYLFLARREKSFLTDLPAVYEPGTYENMKWLYWQGITHYPVVALFLHIDKVQDTRPMGSVTLLDYQESARDVEIFSQLPKPQCDRHIRLVVKRCTKQTCYCTILEYIQYLKNGR